MLFQYLKHLQKLARNPEFAKALKIANNPEFIKAQQIACRSDFLEIQRIANSSEFLRTYNLLKNMPSHLRSEDLHPFIVQVNSAISVIDSLPLSVLQSIREEIVPNKRNTHNDEKTDLEEPSSSPEPPSNHTTNDEATVLSEEPAEWIDDSIPYLDLSEYIAEFISSIDDSVNLPEPNDQKRIHVKKLHPDWDTIIGILVTIIIFICQSVCDAKSQAGLMTEERKQTYEEHLQTQQEIEQTKHLQQQTEYLKKITENIASDSDNQTQSTHNEGSITAL